nr:unnamed protein product [Digitaria exilis]
MAAAAASQVPQTRRGDVGDDAEGIGIGALLHHQDALYEVLLRVPAKPLCRFRAVCRPWRSLLSSPSFAAAHAARHRDQPLLTVCGWVRGSNNRASEIKLLDTFSGRVVRRFDAGPSSLLCRVWPHLGLVLIIRRLVAAAVDERLPTLSVLDPATGGVTALPLPGGGYYDDDTRTSFVFGREQAGDGKYKVLSLNTVLTQPFCKILTVDGGGGAWRHAPAPPVAIKTFHSETVVTSGVVYHLVDSSNGWTMAAFDLKAEQWLPDLLHGPAVVGGQPASINSREGRSLAEVNRCLAAIYSTPSAMDIWLLMGKAQWCKRCRVLMSSASVEWHYWLSPDPVPLWVLNDGRVAFLLRGPIFGNGTLWMYDPRTQASTRLSTCLKIGASAYTGNLLRQQV